MKKGIVYVRISSVDQTQGTSLDNQERACLEYAANNGIEVVRTFIEKGESATAANRTEFLKALEFCRQQRGALNFFIVWKIDRFARNTTDHFSVRAKLTQYGITLQSVTEPITQDHIGKLMETFLAGYAEFENEVRKQRCTGGMQGRLREGIWCWWPPIGYVHSKRIKDRRKTMPDVPDEERFYLIQKGLRLYKAGNHGITSLTTESNKWGLTTRTGKPMSKQLWNVILADKFYAGILVDPWTGEEYHGLHKPMITRAEYEQIRAVKNGKSSHATGRRLTHNPDFPLRRFVLCECGQPYTASWSSGRRKKYASYHCHNEQCVHYGHSVPKDVLENKFHQFLQRVSPSQEFLEFFKQIVIDNYQERCATEKQEKEHCQREQAKLESRRKDLLEMRISKEISKEEYRDLKDIIDKQIARLPSSKMEAEDIIDLEAAISRSVELMGDLGGQWRVMSCPMKQRLQKVVLPQGMTYRKTNGAIGTAILSPIFSLNEEFRREPSGLVRRALQTHHSNVAKILNHVAARRPIERTVPPVGVARARLAGVPRTRFARTALCSLPRPLSPHQPAP